MVCVVKLADQGIDICIMSSGRRRYFGQAQQQKCSESAHSLRFLGTRTAKTEQYIQWSCRVPVVDHAGPWTRHGAKGGCSTVVEWDARTSIDQPNIDLTALGQGSDGSGFARSAPEVRGTESRYPCAHHRKTTGDCTRLIYRRGGNFAPSQIRCGKFCCGKFHGAPQLSVLPPVRVHSVYR